MAKKTHGNAWRVWLTVVCVMLCVGAFASSIFAVIYVTIIRPTAHHKQQCPSLCPLPSNGYTCPLSCPMSCPSLPTPDIGVRNNNDNNRDNNRDNNHNPILTTRVVIDPNAGGAPPDTYPQVGYIKSTDGAASIALYGARSATRRGRFNYYVIPRGGSIKVPLISGGRDCMDEVGCDVLVDGDHVSAPDADNLVGTAKIYNTNNVPRVLLS